MGKMSDLSIEIEDAKILIVSIIDYLKKGNVDSRTRNSIKVLMNFSDEIYNFNDDSINLIINDLSHFYDHIGQLERNEYDENFANEILNEIEKIHFKTQINNNNNNRYNNNNNNNNSEKFYKKKINDLLVRELELEEILASNKNESIEQDKITKDQLNKIKLELDKKEKELEKKQELDDAKSDWENKINNTFDQLKEYLAPITKEHERLNILYYTFAGLSIITIIIISFIEINAVHKLSSEERFPDFQKYLMLFLPLPIAGALMWGFVFQMNRAQRQLIIIANNIHNINYIQGLLISINNLSPNVNDGISRVNKALDKIISNHLNNHIISEEELIKEEDKDKVDNINLEKLTKLIKTVKETSK